MHVYCRFTFNILVFFFLSSSLCSLSLSPHSLFFSFGYNLLCGFGFERVWFLDFSLVLQWWVWGLVWCFNGVSEVMVVVVVVVFGVYGWLVWWSWCVSLVVEDGDRDGVMEEIIIFNIICRYILYYFNELFIKIET